MLPQGPPGTLLGALQRREPAHIKSFCNDPRDLVAWVEEGISSFPSGEFLPKVRVFHAFGQRADFLTRLILSPKQLTEVVPEWVERVLGIREFCLAINGMSAWDGRLHDYVYDHFVEPFVGHFGAPLKPFDVYLFCGAYPLTPFGIHSDAEDSVLLHLGPLEKGALLWLGDSYDRAVSDLEKRLNVFDLERVSDSAWHVVLSPGDLLYIPRRVHHVMTNSNFSHTLGFIPNPVSSAQLLPLLAREVAEYSDDPSSAPYSLEGDLLSAIQGAAQALCPDALQRAAERMTARTRSNGYLTPAPAHLAKAEANGDVTMPSRYPVEYLREGSSLRLFIRGRELRLPNVQCLERAINTIRAGERMTAQRFAAIMSESFAEPAACVIFNRLVELGGLEG